MGLRFRTGGRSSLCRTLQIYSIGEASAYRLATVGSFPPSAIR